MKSTTLVGAICLTFGLTGAAAQGTSQNPTQQPRPGDTMAQEHTITVEGCLVREKDVPGRQPNVAERAGVMEDYILTHAKVLKGSLHTSTGAGTAGATGTTGTEAAGTAGKAAMMFEVRGIDDEKLQQFVGQRVEIEGKVDPDDFPERAREKSTSTREPAGDLPELQGIVIRKASSDAPCTPGASDK